MSNVRVLATDLEFPEGPVVMPDGSVVLVEIRGKRLTRVWPDGRKEVVAEIPGGPNGAAIGPDLEYAVSLDGSIYALSGGVVQWTLPTGAPIGSVATLSHGVIYVSVSDGTIDAVDAGTGHPRWSVQLKGGPGPAIVADGRLYAGTNLGLLASRAVL